MESQKKKVLILCTGNSARSIMAEFLINHELGDRWQAFSAGVMPGQVQPLALEVLDEIQVPHPGARSKSVSEFLDREDLDLVITVCDQAQETCPVFAKPVNQIHLGIEDPAPYANHRELGLLKFRTARDAIRTSVIEYLKGRSV